MNSNMNVVDFKELVRRIESSEILLPDFQRQFVWKDEEQQKELVASVLAKMPIGSILLLRSKPDEYLSKFVGLKKEIDTSSIQNREVEFLLDGQQRITVLTNVFSSVIHDNYEQISELVSPSLKKRFFLRIPKWSKSERDLFGVKTLDFTIQNPEHEEPGFLSADILQFIECQGFTRDDEKPYNPNVNLSKDLDDYCLSHKDGYLVPLFLMYPSENPKNATKDQMILRRKKIIEKIGDNIKSEIADNYVKLQEENDKKAFLSKVLKEYSQDEEILDAETLEEKLKEKAEVWSEHLRQYLDACMTELSLNQIIVSEAQRARAIDIYENLNKGGVSLNTFDLIMARVAKVSTSNFYERIVKCISESKWNYPQDIIPENIQSILNSKIQSQKYNASMNTGCYNTSKNEISTRYINAFLNILSLCYHNNKSVSDDFRLNNHKLLPDNFKLENMKKDKILDIKPEALDENCELICEALDRALFFFQTRCGIRKIQEINYQLMIALVGTIFVNKDYFEDKRVHNLLEAWYWSSIFSGQYDKDQNIVMIQDLQDILKTLSGDKTRDWLKTLKDEYVLNAQNFSDEEFLLHQKVDRYPKVVMRDFMCQYLLSQTYPDMFDAQKALSVFGEIDTDNKNDILEAHHIIPLGTVKNVAESTKELRKKKEHICNSPLNFVYITKGSNQKISDTPISEYASQITDEAKTKLHINEFTQSQYGDDNILGLLRGRFSYLKGSVKNHIDTLLKSV